MMEVKTFCSLSVQEIRRARSNVSKDEKMDVDQKWKELYGNKGEESSDDESPSSPMEFQEWQRHVPPVRRD